MANLYNEEIQRIYIDIESGDLPDFSAKADEAAKKLGELRTEADKAEKAMATLAAQGKAGSDEFVTLQIHSEDLKAEIKALNKEQKEYANALDITQMSSKQLADRAKVLRQALNETSQAADPETWDRLNDEYIKVTRRMSEVRAGTISVSDSMDITQMSTRQLAAYSKQLAERMADIPGAASNPEWQRLKGRLDNVKKQMGELENPIKENAKISTMMGNLYTKGVTLVINGLKKMGQDFISHSNAIGDRWTRTTTGMRKSYEAFLTAITTGSWSGLFSNMAKAYQEGRKLAELADDIFEMQNATSLTETRNRIEITRQTATMRDTTKTNEERIAASEEILRLEKEIMDAKQRTAEREREVAIEALKLRTKMSDAEITYIVDDFFQNEENISLASDYLKLQKRLATATKGARRSGSNIQLAKSYIDDANKIRAEIDAMEKKFDGVEKWADLMRRYDLANDEMISNYVNAQNEYLRASAEFEQGTLRAKTTRAKLQEELANEQYTKAVELASRQALEEANIIKQQYLDRKITSEQMNAELEKIEAERLQRVNEINAKFGKDISESTGAVLDNMISAMDGFTQTAANGSDDALNKALQKSKEVNAELEKMIDLSYESIQSDINTELDAEGQKLESDVRQAGEIKTRFADTDTKLTLLSADKDAEIAQLQSLYDQGLIAEQEYQAAKNNIIKKYAQQAAQIQTEAWQNGLQTASGFLNNISSLVSSIQNAESASLDAQMQKELTAAGNNAEARAAIEEKYEQKKLDLQKKYADIDMGIKIAQAIAAGALAAIQAFAQLGPVAGGIMAGIIAATTAAQVATIIMQRNAIKNSTASSSSSGSTSVRTLTFEESGYSEGGFTGYGGRLEPAGIVHRGEYVVPVPEMRDPEAYSHVMAIERIRSRRTAKNRLPGFADGGYTGNAMPGTTLDGVMSELRALRRNPIKAYVVLSELDAQRNIRDTHLKAGSRS